jgi:hypothetical protein
MANEDTLICDDLLLRIRRILEANYRSAEEKKAHLLRMENIDHTSPEADYQAKLKWLSATGQGGQLKAMIKARAEQHYG